MGKFVDTKQLPPFLESLAEGDKAVQDLLTQTLFHALKKEPEALDIEGASWSPHPDPNRQIHYAFNAAKIKRHRETMDKILHVRDWIKAALATKAPWLQQKDEAGNYMRLRFIGTLQAAVNLANKDMEKVNQRLWQKNAADVTLPLSDEETSGAIQTILINADGTRWVRLVTPDALRREGPRMGHCIGGGAYDDKQKDPAFAYYSLRDKANRPHLTLEVEKNAILQCQGKNNKPPLESYFPALQNLIKKQGWTLSVPPERCGLIQGFAAGETESRLFPIRHLPAHFTTEKDLDLRALDDFFFPKNLTVSGDFYPNADHVFSLPRDITVKGRTIIKGDIAYSGLRSPYFPPHMIIEGHALLSGSCLKQLPDHLTVTGRLSADKTCLQELPENLTAQSLSLRKTKISRLPTSLKVRQDLVIDDTLITSLPPLPFAPQRLFLKNTPIRTVPAAWQRTQIMGLGS